MKKGFTLAEVLITLGIIGVVAAITLPTLIQNYQKIVWVNQLKKSYSLIEQGFQKMMVDEGVDKLRDVSFISSLEDDCFYGDDRGECKSFYSALKNYFKGEYRKINRKMCFLWDNSICDENYDDIYLSLTDGTDISIIYVPSGRVDDSRCKNIKLNGGHMCSFVGFVLTDINGKKGPNVYGRDIFSFYISDEGKLYGQGGKDYYLYNNSGNLSGYTLGFECIGKKFSDGSGCTGYIIENGWKMDY